MATTRTRAQRKNGSEVIAEKAEIAIAPALPDLPSNDTKEESVRPPMDPVPAQVTVVGEASAKKESSVADYLEAWLADKIAPVANILNDAADRIEELQSRLKLFYLQKHLQMGSGPSVEMPIDHLIELAEEAKKLIGNQASSEESDEIKKLKSTPAKEVSMYSVLVASRAPSNDLASFGLNLTRYASHQGSTIRPRLHSWDAKETRCIKCGFLLEELVEPTLYLERKLRELQRDDGYHQDVLIHIKTSSSWLKLIARSHPVMEMDLSDKANHRYLMAKVYQTGSMGHQGRLDRPDNTLSYAPGNKFETKLYQVVPFERDAPTEPRVRLEDSISLVFCSEREGEMITSDGDANRFRRTW